MFWTIAPPKSLFFLFLVNVPKRYLKKLKTKGQIWKLVSKSCQTFAENYFITFPKLALFMFPHYHLAKTLFSYRNPFDSSLIMKNWNPRKWLTQMYKLWMCIVHVHVLDVGRVLQHWADVWDGGGGGEGPGEEGEGRRAAAQQRGANIRQHPGWQGSSHTVRECNWLLSSMWRNLLPFPSILINFTSHIELCNTVIIKYSVIRQNFSNSAAQRVIWLLCLH